MPTLLEKRLGKKPTGLPQSLQPNERGVKLFYNGEFVGYENISIPTPEQIDAEIKAEAREMAIQKIAKQEEDSIRAKRGLKE